jgi:hypothetical protein
MSLRFACARAAEASASDRDDSESDLAAEYPDHAASSARTESRTASAIESQCSWPAWPSPLVRLVPLGVLGDLLADLARSKAFGHTEAPFWSAAVPGLATRSPS